MMLLVGLGNPGAGYAGHRHNFGFMAVDAIARAHGFGPWRRKFAGEAAEGMLGGVRVLALKPMTYMNLSGRAVAEAAGFYKLAPGAVTVLHDDLDLPLGRLRVKIGGGHGGQNGVRDIAAAIGPEFRRVRLGIGHPGDKALVEHYVLQDFAKAERPVAAAVIDAVAAEAPRLAVGDDSGFASQAMERVNPKPRKPPRPPAAAEVRTGPDAAPDAGRRPAGKEKE
jgi:peptidyl-tRNA hydrolase, PTH1 family